MAVALIRLGEGGALPPMCAKTGRPTTGTVEVTAVHIPAWMDLFATTTIIAWLWARANPGRRVRVTVPVSDGAVRRHRLAWWVSIAIGVAGVALIAVGAGTGRPALLPAGLAVIVLATLAGAVGTVLTWFATSYRSGTGEVELRRVHPAFAAAVVDFAR